MRGVRTLYVGRSVDFNFLIGPLKTDGLGILRFGKMRHSPSAGQLELCSSASCSNGQG
jgi:hypothetical protein